MREVNAPNCERHDDLISSLYGELNEADAVAFQRHLSQCQSCSAEFAGLKQVRESVVAWRNESLGSVVLSAPEVLPGRIIETTPSAIAALREFFKLSPLWLKGAVAFASILFCLLAGLAVARLGEQPSAPVVATTSNSDPSQEQLDAIVRQRVQEELQRMKEADKSSIAASDDRVKDSAGTPRTKTPIRTALARNNLSHSARRPLSKTERQQLAADLRLISSQSDTDLDLLEDRINQ
jgi:anti-sigma factor RsiW